MTEPLRTLYHFPMDPASRMARLTLGEKKMDYRETVVRYWEPNPEFEALNPSGLTPVLMVADPDEPLILCETRAITEWADEAVADPPLMPKGAKNRAEARRIIQWFERKFDYEVNALLLHEKMEKRLLGLGTPDGAALRNGRETLRRHMEHFEGLLADGDWLAGRRLSLADLAAAAHLSILDYFGEVPWGDFAACKLWYMKIKSRPSFRPLLSDRLPGMPPSLHYHDLDF